MQIRQPTDIKEMEKSSPTQTKAAYLAKMYGNVSRLNGLNQICSISSGSFDSAAYKTNACVLLLWSLFSKFKFSSPLTERTDREQGGHISNILWLNIVNQVNKHIPFPSVLNKGVYHRSGYIPVTIHAVHIVKDSF